MILKCLECEERIDTQSEKVQLVKIGGSYKCIRCRGFKFVVEALDK